MLFFKPINEVTKKLKLSKSLDFTKEKFLHYLVSNFKYDTSGFDPLVKASFDNAQATGQLEYVYNYSEGCFIEPVYGWGISENNEVIYASIPYAKEIQVKFPGAPGFWLLKNLSKVIRLKKAISIRYEWGNYFHFLNDVMGQMYLIEKYSIPNDVPVIIPTSALKVKHVKYFLGRLKCFKDRPIIYQNRDVLIHVEEALFLKNTSNVKEHFLYTTSQLEYATDPCVRKIFLTRRNVKQRVLKNIDDIEDLFRRNGFEIVDAAELTIDETIRIFSNVSHLAAIHGAGMTNMIFNRNKDMKVLEIFSASGIPPHYFWLSNELGYSYSAIYGGYEIEGKFELDPLKLQTELDKLV